MKYLSTITNCPGGERLASGVKKTNLSIQLRNS